MFPEDRWKKETEYAVIKNTNKTATRVLPGEEEANKYILELGDTKNRYRIEKREGEDVRCHSYCLCAPHCSFWREKYGKI